MGIRTYLILSNLVLIILLIFGMLGMAEQLAQRLAAEAQLRESFDLIELTFTEEQAKAEIRRATRVFVRRQANWFKVNDPSIRWFDAGISTIEEMEAYLLQQLAKTVEQQWHLRVELKMEGFDGQVPAVLAREIYQIIREGLVNAARHSRASVVHVDLQADEDNARDLALRLGGRDGPGRRAQRLLEALRDDGVAPGLPDRARALHPADAEGARPLPGQVRDAGPLRRFDHRLAGLLVRPPVRAQERPAGDGPPGQDDADLAGAQAGNRRVELLDHRDAAVP